MTPADKQELATILSEAAAMYQVSLGHAAIAAYYRVLKHLDLDAVRRAVLDLLGDESRKDIMPRAAEIKAVAGRYQGGRTQAYIRCQASGCRALIPWPPTVQGEAGMYCPSHQDHAQHGPPATPEERRAILARLRLYER
jgi:hypothetical protein